MKVLLIIAAIVGICVAVVYYGPYAASQEWTRLEPKAEADVTDVVQRGLESYLSQAGQDLSKAHSLPQVRGVDFLIPAVQFSIPEKIGFHGTTTGGNFQGFYYKNTGEVEATCEVGGQTFAGLSMAYRPGNKTFDVTGRKKDGQLEVEMNGKPAVVVYPKKTQE